jgi:DNA-binding transcriptional regulator YiaG
MALATVPYDISVDHDGKRYDVHLPAMTVPQCTNCGAMSLDDSATEQIDTAFRRMAGLLLPSEILQGRIDVGFPNQQEFAKCIGVSAGTVSRWENGSQVQQHFHDGMLRAFFRLEELRIFLANLHGVTYSAGGITEVAMVFNAVSLSVDSLRFAGASAFLADEDSTTICHTSDGLAAGYKPIREDGR